MVLVPVQHLSLLLEVGAVEHVLAVTFSTVLVSPLSVQVQQVQYPTQARE